MALFIGLMSGTSLDGVDGVLVSFVETGRLQIDVRGHAHRPFPPALQAELLALNAPGNNELHRAALAANEVVRVCTDVVSALLPVVGSVSRDAVRAIGVHGQTVRHRPGEFDGLGYTVQLNAPALLAELTGLDVIADFRSRDVAAGGQGAPLVPAFHRAAFGEPGKASVVLNLGGIANLTVLAADGDTTGFDCGPGNLLMDLWCRRHSGRPFDADGAWAASGRVIEPLLVSMLAEPFFAALPPKSTGRDLFDAGWLDGHLRGFATARPEDVQATLAELTARSSAAAIKRHAADATDVRVCGGGALNRELMRRIADCLPGVAVVESDRHGLPAAQVEACAFAWLARAFLERSPGNLMAVTGARGPRVLGALYPGMA